MKLNNKINDIKTIELPYDFSDNGELVVAEGLNHVPFAIARFFIVKASANSVRGQHAHMQCSQFLICSYGEIQVICNDGMSSKIFLLNRNNFGLHIPCGIWSEQKYILNNSLLSVLCDKPYEESDYIRSYDEYKKYLISINN